MKTTLEKALEWKAEQIPEDARCHGCGGQGYIPGAEILGTWHAGKICPECKGTGSLTTPPHET